MPSISQPKPPASHLQLLEVELREYVTVVIIAVMYMSSTSHQACRRAMSAR